MSINQIKATTSKSEIEKLKSQHESLEIRVAVTSKEMRENSRKIDFNFLCRLIFIKIQFPQHSFRINRRSSPLMMKSPEKLILQYDDLELEFFEVENSFIFHYDTMSVDTCELLIW